MEAKLFVLCCYESEPYTLLLFWTRFKQGEKVFLVSVPRSGICRRQAHVLGVTRWEVVILNYESGTRCVLPDIIGEVPAWPRKNGNELKLFPTRIQNWTREFCALFLKMNVDNQYMPNTSYS